MNLSICHNGTRFRTGARLFAWIGFFILAAALLLPCPVWAAGVAAVNVKAYGKALNTGDTAGTRKEAIDQALKAAVKEALSGFLEELKADPVTIEAAIFANAGSYVLNYKILSERWLREMIIEEPPTSVIPETGPEMGPDAGDETKSGTSTPPDEETEDGTVIETYHVLIEASVDLGSLKKAMERIAPGIAEAEIKLVILDIPDYDTFNMLMGALKRMAVIEDLSYRSFKRGRFVMRLKSSIDTRTLADEIARAAGKDFVVSSGGPGMIIVRAFPEARDSGR